MTGQQLKRRNPETQIAVALAEKVQATDKLLERVYQIAEDLADTSRNGRARRAGRRICNLIDQVDETLGLDGE